MNNGPGQAGEVAPPRFGLYLSGGYGLFFLYVGIYLPFFPYWLQSRGLNPTEIGIVLAIPMFVRVLTSSKISALADDQPDRAIVLSILYWLSFAGSLFYLAGNGFWWIAFVTLVFNVFFNPLLPLFDALTLSGVRRFGADYGNIRILGSVTFIIANLAGGALLGVFPADFIIWTLIAMLGFGALYSFMLPRIGRAQAATPAGRNTGQEPSVWQLPFVIMLFAAGLLQASHALLYGFGTIYWEQVGYSGTLIGAFWALGVTAEIILFKFTTVILKRVTPVQLMAVGALGAILRWSLFTLEPGLFGTLFLQVLHGLSFGATHIATMYFIMQSVPEQKIGSAQGVGFMIGGISMAVAVLGSGVVFEKFGPDGFWFAATISFAALAMVAWHWLSQPQSSLEGGETVLEE